MWKRKETHPRGQRSQTCCADVQQMRQTNLQQTVPDTHITSAAADRDRTTGIQTLHTDTHTHTQMHTLTQTPTLKDAHMQRGEERRGEDGPDTHTHTPLPQKLQTVDLHLSACLPACLPVCLPVCLPDSLPVCLAARL